MSAFSALATSSSSLMPSSFRSALAKSKYTVFVSTIANLLRLATRVLSASSLASVSRTASDADWACFLASAATVPTSPTLPSSPWICFWLESMAWVLAAVRSDVSFRRTSCPSTRCVSLVSLVPTWVRTYSLVAQALASSAMPPQRIRAAVRCFMSLLLGLNPLARSGAQRYRRAAGFLAEFVPRRQRASEQWRKRSEAAHLEVIAPTGSAAEHRARASRACNPYTAFGALSARCGRDPRRGCTPCPRGCTRAAHPASPSLPWTWRGNP